MMGTGRPVSLVSDTYLALSHERGCLTFVHRMFSLKNKKQNRVVFITALLVFASGVFLLTPSVAHGAYIIDTAIKGLLLAIFTMMGWLTSIAITIFSWAVNPDYISGNDGLLNRSSVYAMWKFIRDFFNLFFILTLLYTAFTIVFQVAKDYKKTLLSLVLAALFINFSFPVTRVIIDMANVPMYYFANQIGSQTGGSGNNWLGPVLSASQLKDILIPRGENSGSVNLETTDMSRLIMAIVFLFLFSITLLVLALMFIVRLAALIILLIFSSVGFAAAAMPALSKYSNQWWEKLWQYVIFGPAAMLMLFVATRFFAEISKDNTSAQFLAAGINNATPETAGFISSMAMFSIPIIILWMAIGLASSFSIAGAGAVVGTGQKFAKWAGKKTYNNPIGRGLYGGIKKVGMEGKVFGGDYSKLKLGRFQVGKALTGNYWAKPSKLEATIRGGMTGRSGAVKEQNKLHQQEVNERVKKNKENQVGDSALTLQLDSSDRVEREAAALYMVETKGIDSALRLKKALVAVGDNRDYVASILKSAPDRATAGLSGADLKAITNNEAFAQRDAQNKPMKNGRGEYVVEDSANFQAIKEKLKDSGQLKTLLEYERDQNVLDGKSSGVALNDALLKVLGNLTAKDLAKQTSLHDNSNFNAHLKIELTYPENRQYYQDVFKNMTKESQQKWITAGNTP